MADDQTEKNKLIRAQELEDIRALLQLPEGIRFFKRLFTLARIWSTTFTGNSQTFFLEGQRNLGLIIYSDVAEASPEKILSIILEGRE